MTSVCDHDFEKGDGTLSAHCLRCGCALTPKAVREAGHAGRRCEATVIDAVGGGRLLRCQLPKRHVPDVHVHNSVGVNMEWKDQSMTSAPKRPILRADGPTMLTTWPNGRPERQDEHAVVAGMLDVDASDIDRVAGGGGPYFVETRENDRVLAREPIPDPFIHTKLHPRGWRAAWAVLRGRYEVSVLVSADKDTIERVFLLDPDYLGRKGGPRRKAWDASFHEALGGVGDD